MDTHCFKCDAPLSAVTRHLRFYGCGRVTDTGGTALLTCVHQGRLDRTRCRADTGRPMTSFREWMKRGGQIPDKVLT